jgi:hypothetical protein
MNAFRIAVKHPHFLKVAESAYHRDAKDIQSGTVVNVFLFVEDREMIPQLIGWAGRFDVWAEARQLCTTGIEKGSTNYCVICWWNLIMKLSFC